MNGSVDGHIAIADLRTHLLICSLSHSPNIAEESAMTVQMTMAVTSSFS